MDSSLRDLLACLSERTVTIEDAGTFRVPPPTVRQALAVVAALEAHALREARAWEVLVAACRAWLPADLCEVYFSEFAPSRAVLQDVRDLLKMGLQDEDRHEKDQEEVESAARRRTWFAVLTDYAEALATPPAAVLETPWPLFVALCAEVLRLQARRQADYALGYAAGKLGGDMLDAILKGAGYTPAPEQLPEREFDDEFVKRQQEKAIAYRTHYGKPG